MPPCISRFVFRTCLEILPLITLRSGVPRILSDTFPPHLQANNDGTADWHIYEDYMRTTRINVNVRQVFPKGFDPGLEVVHPQA